MNEKFERFKSGVINSMGFIIVFVVIAVYVAKNFVDIQQSGKTPLEIIADGLFALIFGFSVKVLLGYQGVLSGMSNSRMIQTLDDHASIIKEVDKYLPLLPSFCERENANLRIRRRRTILSRQCLHYEDVFTDDPSRLETAIASRVDAIQIANKRVNDGSLKYKLLVLKERRERRKTRKRIMRCVRKANNVTFTELTQYELTTDGGNKNNPFKFAVNPGIHMTKRSPGLLPASLLVSVLIGYFGFRLIKDPNAATIIAAIVQTGTFVLTGAVQFMKEYLYTMDRYRKSIIRKIDILNQFKQEAEKQNGEPFAIPQEIIHKKSQGENEPCQNSISTNTNEELIPA